VCWPAFDRAGTEQASERSFYILQEDEEGRVRIRVAAAISKAGERAWPARFMGCGFVDLRSLGQQQQLATLDQPGAHRVLVS
jgi:hypothetical protein